MHTVGVADSQNSALAAAPRAGGRPFPSGVSGNPGGRPKGLVRRIRDETGDGAELVDYMLGVFRDEHQPTRTRVEAATWLADRGYGKPAPARTPPPDDDAASTIVVESIVGHRGVSLNDLLAVAANTDQRKGINTARSFEDAKERLARKLAGIADTVRAK